MIDSCGRTHVGLVRANNEDSFDSVPELGLFVVADGLGGAAGGERASAVAVRTLLSEARGATEPLSSQTLLAAIELANRLIRLESESDPSLRGMGTTVTAAVARAGRLEIVNAGDSRAYLFSGNQLRCLTRDHTVAREMAAAAGLDEDQLKNHRYRHILTKAVGMEALVRADTVEAQFSTGDILLLCSDGLHGVLSSERIANCLAGDSPLPEKARCLINATLHGGAPDNVTVLLARHPDESRSDTQ